MKKERATSHRIGGCIMEMLDYCPSVSDPEFNVYATLSCGHKIHSQCLRVKLEETHLGFTVAGTSERSVINVIGANCFALGDDFKPICSEPIPWSELFEAKLFGHHTKEAEEVWANEIASKRIEESVFMQHCPGRGCTAVAVTTKPLTNATNIMQCADCKVIIE